MKSAFSIPLKNIIDDLESGNRPIGGIMEGQGGVFSIGGEHLNDNGGFNLTNERRIPVEYFQAMKRGIVKPKDILIVKDGATTGKVSYVQDNFSGFPCSINEHVFRLSIKPELADAKYVFYYLYSPQGNHEIMLDFHGATIGGISQDFIQKVQIPLPPLPEQKRITVVLDKADRLCRLCRYVLELGDNYLQSAFLKLFGDPVTNPMRWDVRTLKNIGVKFSYGTNAKCDYEKIGFPVLRIPNVLSGKLDLSDLKYAELPKREIEQLQLQKGDVIFVRTNGNPDYVGRCAVFNLDGPFMFASYLIRARVNEKVVQPLFLNTYMHLQAGRMAMFPFIRTTAGQSNIGMEGLGQISVPLPPLPIQEKFVQVVERHERLRSQQREALRQSEHLFQSLLSMTFNGGL